MNNCPQCGVVYDLGAIFCDNCGVPLSAPRPPVYASDGLVDTTFVGERGTYLIKRLVTSGGQSRVYEAQWLEKNRQVCVKVFTEKFSGYIETEKKLLPNLQHPNIIQMFDIGVFSNSAKSCIVMEFIAGGSVEDRFGNAFDSLSLSEVIAILSQVASALDAVHSANFVHCDVKPSNILLDDFRVVLADFGIARSIGEHFTESIGTPLYSSPEQLNGMPVTAASDIYSFAVVAYELLLRGLLRKPNSDRTKMSDEILTDLPRQVSQVILKALSNNPMERYRSAREFAEELIDEIRTNSADLINASEISFTAQSTVVAPPLPPPPPTRSFPSSILGYRLVERLLNLFRKRKPMYDDTIGYSKAFDTEAIDDSSTDDLQNIRTRILVEIEKAMEVAKNQLEGGSKIQKECFEILRDEKLKLMQATDENKTLVFVEVQFRLQLLYGTFRRERMIEGEERNWRWIVPGIILFYTGVVVTVIVLGSQLQADMIGIPILGVPISVLLWAGIGSLAAILYRFYTRRIGRLGNEIKWLIARPIIGIIMGALAYLTILSGLFVFSGATGVNADIALAKPQLIWLLAFLGGFSDKFFETIIAGLIGRLSHSDGDASRIEAPINYG